MAGRSHGYGMGSHNPRPYRPNSPYRHHDSPGPDAYHVRPNMGTPQYFTSGNTPNTVSPHVPQQAMYSPRPGTPYNQYSNRAQYTPSPISPYQRSPHRFTSTPRQRGGSASSNWRSSSNHRGSNPHHGSGERAPIEAFFSEDMLKDPWENIKPVPIDRSSFTTV